MPAAPAPASATPSSHQDGPVAACRGVRVAFGDVVALDDATVEIGPGVTGLIGANGAGKSTMLKALLGLVRPDEGHVELLGRDVATDPVAARERVGFMPEDRCLPDDEPAADVVAFAARLSGLPADEARRRAAEVLGICGLGEARFRAIGTFSTGMAQRAKLAQAIVHGPDLVLLDEPASGLDPEGREELLALISRLGAFGLSVVLSSHVLADLEATCEHMVLVDAGRVLRSGPIGALTGDGSLIVEVVGDAAALAAALDGAGLQTQDVQGATLRVRGEGDLSSAVRDAALRTDVGLRRLSRRSRSLEDVVLDAVGGAHGHDRPGGGSA